MHEGYGWVRRASRQANRMMNLPWQVNHPEVSCAGRSTAYPGKLPAAQ
jgi:hypothetical protein